MPFVLILFLTSLIYTHLIHAYMNLQVSRKPTQIGVGNIKQNIKTDMFFNV